MPVIDLGQDAASVSIYTAAGSHPQNFAYDFFYYTNSHFGYYVSIYIPYLKLFSPIFGGYGLTYLTMAIPIIFLQLTGFYFLGKKLFKNRFWEILLAVFSLFQIYTETGDYWGIFRDPQPRMLFGALFPWLLMLSYKGLHNIKWSIVAFVFAGLLSYIHPLSACGVAFAIWFAQLLFKKKEQSIKKHILHMFGLGLIFLRWQFPSPFNT